MGAPAVAAILMRQDKDLVEHFRRLGALSAASARSAGDLGVERGPAWDRLISRGVVLEAAPGRYYFDEASWTAAQRTRRRGVFVLVLVVLAITAVALTLAVRAVRQ